MRIVKISTRKLIWMLHWLKVYAWFYVSFYLFLLHSITFYIETVMSKVFFFASFSNFYEQTFLKLFIFAQPNIIKVFKLVSFSRFVNKFYEKPSDDSAKIGNRDLFLNRKKSLTSNINCVIITFNKIRINQSRQQLELGGQE